MNLNEKNKSFGFRAKIRNAPNQWLNMQNDVQKELKHHDKCKH